MAYKFEYVSTNMMLENFLKVICNDFGIDYIIDRYDSITTLFVDDTEERLHKFADYISFYLPLSIFLKSMSVEVVDKIEHRDFVLKACDMALPFTKKAYTLAKDSNSVFFNNPFTPNEVGKNCKDYNMSISFGEKHNMSIANNPSSFKKAYEEIVDLIAKNESVIIKNPNGNFAFSKVSKEVLENIDNFEIIATDLSNIQKMVIMEENEIKNLASLEKPIIKARINSIYASKGIIPQKSVKIRMPNTLLLQFICNELHKIGVDFIVKSQANEEIKYFVDYENECPKIEDMEVCVLENNEVLVLRHDNLPKNITKGLDKLKVPAIKQYTSILKERKLFDYKTSCFYFSKTFDDAIMFYDHEKGMLELIKFPLPSSTEAVFETIEASGESGKKLIKNYKKKFPEIYQRALSTKIPTKIANNLFNLLAFSSLILGLSDNFENAAEKLIEYAKSFGGRKGSRIEFTLRDKTKINSDFDAIKMIRSAMSFKLAGADEAILCFGFFDSFSYFLSDIADIHKETLSSSKITLGGSLFGTKKLTEMTCRNLLPNHKIYFNRELPIDNL